MNSALLAFAISLTASLLLTIPVRALALRVGMVDLPGPRKVHSEPIPLLGGLAIYGAVVLALLLVMDAVARGQSAGILAGATLVAVTGMLDDRGLLHHQIKLFVAMPLAAVLLMLNGIHAQVFRVLLGGRSGQIADIALTIFWVVGITAAFSILDHMDGLCAGTAAVASAFFALLARQNGQALAALLAATVLGAALGFLRWNFKPAKIFMGDGGAMFLGFLMATLGLQLRFEQAPPAAGWMIPVLILIVPVFDTTLVTISRARRGLLPFTSPGKDHCAHRLANLGLEQRGAVLALYALGALGGILALLVSRVSPAGVLCAFLGVAIGILGGVALLEQAPYQRQEKK
ncbi:MAG: undecaprenyl/decaprenyl-phosphate alpha-N-acetylglucosaminyl 1-phosphate transferase [Acidobacteriia bacterium]|nr:undecaprenyl/decaprenyl-phosphate alpha-N-acetylglucosaminyl 1-phosphate transferase [Terriglobia bacterium]